MKVRKLLSLAMTTSLLFIGVLGEVNARTFTVKCEVRASPARSKISVDGVGYAGKYFAQVKSGGVL